jgi:hypothetical protein
MSHSTTYQPSGIKPGTSVIGFASTLAGYTAPGNYATTTFTVTAPNSAMSFCNGYSALYRFDDCHPAGI